MTETVTTCLLNPRATWQLSWERIATWGRPWRRCVQRGDVLITSAVCQVAYAQLGGPTSLLEVAS